MLYTHPPNNKLINSGILDLVVADDLMPAVADARRASTA